MKFLCLIAISLALPLSVASFPARAASPKYGRADSKDVYFCERKDLDFALFTIPYTYCVEIISSDGEWSYVRYAEDTALYKSIYGYCQSDKLTLIDTPPENIYLNMPVTVTFRSDAPAGSLPVLSELNVTAAFYGTYYSGPTAYSYVFYDGQFGYIYGANDDYPLNEIVEPEEPLPEKGKVNSKIITVVALALVAAVTLAVLYFTGRKKYFKT